MNCPPPPDDDDLARKRERRNANQQAWRQRQRSGLKVAPAPYDATVLQKLIDSHWLDEADVDDRAAIGNAMYRALRTLKVG